MERNLTYRSMWILYFRLIWLINLMLNLRLVLNLLLLLKLLLLNQRLLILLLIDLWLLNELLLIDLKHMLLLTEKRNIYIYMNHMHRETETNGYLQPEFKALKCEIFRLTFSLTHFIFQGGDIYLGELLRLLLDLLLLYLLLQLLLLQELLLLNLILYLLGLNLLLLYLLLLLQLLYLLSLDARRRRGRDQLQQTHRLATLKTRVA